MSGRVLGETSRTGRCEELAAGENPKCRQSGVGGRAGDSMDGKSIMIEAFWGARQFSEMLRFELVRPGEVSWRPAAALPPRSGAATARRMVHQARGAGDRHTDFGGIFGRMQVIQPGRQGAGVNLLQRRPAGRAARRRPEGGRDALYVTRAAGPRSTELFLETVRLYRRGAEADVPEGGWAADGERVFRDESNQVVGVAFPASRPRLPITDSQRATGRAEGAGRLRARSPR